MDKPTGAQEALLVATKACLEELGYAGLTTRKVAEAAGIPLSQIHYHFGSKRGLVLALLAAENERLLERQADMFGTDLPLWRRWEMACDFFDQDLESGYVRVLQEMIAASWAEPEIAAVVRTLLQGWRRLLVRISDEAADRLGGLGPFEPLDVAVLMGAAFLGAESMVLIGAEDDGFPVRASLRKVGQAIRRAEEAKGGSDEG
jgi:AcrR family transcriptional regulator